MQLRFQNLFLTFSVALGVAATLMGQGGGYTTIDFPQATQTLAWGINKSGHIAGQYTLAGVTHGFKLIGGRFMTIDYPGSTYTDVRGINDRGDVTGQYRLADNVNHGFLMVGERFTSVDFPNATSTLGWGVGPSGEVVGQYTLAGVGRAFKLSGNEFVTIDIPGATGGGGAATGINALGEVSGITTISGATHAFLWRGGEVTLFDVPGSTYTNSTKVTARGEVIGRYEVNGVGSGYFLRGGIFTTQRFPGAIFTGTGDMNERGDIVGRYQNPDQTFHGFLLSGQPSACVSFVPRVAAATGGMAVTHANDFRLVNAANPAAPGEVLSLFASGLGPTQPGVEPGRAFPANPLGVVSSAVEVRIDGKLAEVFGAVGLPGSVDGYQVNFRVPADARQGAAVLQLSAGMAVDTLRIMIQ
jgi:probable HAF family extracellular repeat protein